MQPARLPKTPFKRSTLSVVRCGRAGHGAGPRWLCSPQQNVRLALIPKSGTAADGGIAKNLPAVGVLLLFKPGMVVRVCKNKQSRLASRKSCCGMLCPGGPAAWGAGATGQQRTAVAPVTASRVTGFL